MSQSAGTPSAKQIFIEALDLPPSDRAAFMDRACAGDGTLRHRVEDLLRVYEGAGVFLGSPTATASVQGAPGFSGVLTERPGTRIGPYKLLQLIGEGGFGSVFMAEQQEPVVRRVALKIIKLGMDTKAVIARFEAERQALALMDHPNIARVLDAGATETGRPYFVMELVRGEPITAYCDKHSLPTEDRLRLFIDICHAVQHAHQKGIIHRDIKPSNILVTIADGRAIPKVIDFGIAKATISRLTEKTLFTEHRQLIGTPEYMSPEQAEMSGVDIDTRSDVYSLGVLLYELLTGTTPFDATQLRSAAFNEIQRIIREVDPPRPSTRLSTLGDAATDVASRRHTEPAKLSRLVRGDLDWIVMKALEKDRARRYDTPNSLAGDVERHLRQEAVAAGPPGSAYRLRKFARRHRVAVLAGSAVFGTLVLGVIGTSVALVWALGERGRAEVARAGEAAQRRAAEENERKALASEAQAREEATRAGTALDVLNEMLAPARRAEPVVGPPAPDGAAPESEAPSFAQRLDTFSRAWGLQVHADPGVESEVRMIVGRTLRSAGASVNAAGQFERTFELRRRLKGERDPDTFDALAAWVEALAASGDRAGSVRVARDAVDSLSTLGVPDDGELAERLHLLADALNWAADYGAAEAPAREALDLLTRAGLTRTTRFGDILSLLGDLATRRREWDSAEDFFARSAELYRNLKGEFDAGTIRAERRNVAVMQSRGDRARAAEAYRVSVERGRRAVAAGNSTPDDRLELAWRLALYTNALTFVSGGLPEAERAERQEIEVRREVGDRDPTGLVKAMTRLGNVLWMMGRYAEAEKVLREALAVPETDENLSDLIMWKGSAAGSLSMAIRDGGGDTAEAEVLTRQAIQNNRNAPDHWTLWLQTAELAVLCRLQGRDAEALELERKAAAIGTHGAVHSFGIGKEAGAIGRRLDDFGQHATAETFLTLHESILRELSPDDWARFDAKSQLGACLAAQGKFTQAEPMLLESADRLQAIGDTPPESHRHSVERVAALYEAWNKAEPGNGFDGKAAAWHARLDALPRSQQASPSH